MRILLIGNPIAGRGSARAAVDGLVARLSRRGHAVDVCWTERPGHATALAAARRESADCVVSAGGDGTLREVYAGLAAAAPILPLPLGTGNMMSRELFVPADPERQIDLIESGAERRIDVGRVGGNPFLAVVGVGFDAMVTRVIGEERGEALGFRGYLLPILRAALRYRPPALRVSVDDGAPIDCGFVVVTKVRRYGGIMRISDTARLDSGELEVCLVAPASVPHLLLLGPMALTGTLRHAPGFEMRSARRVRIDVPDGHAPAPAEVDGDFLGPTPIEIAIEPGGARVVAPALGALP